MILTALATVAYRVHDPKWSFAPTSVLWQDFYCDWRRMVFNENREPPSWVIGDQVLAAGAKGILFRSALASGTNLVLFNDVLSCDDELTAHDPRHALPRNQDSWQ